jgi:hypothetical protein
MASAVKWDWLTGTGQRLGVAAGQGGSSPLLHFAELCGPGFSRVMSLLPARDLLALGSTCKLLCWEVMVPGRSAIWRSVYLDEIAAAGARALEVGAKVPAPVELPLPPPLTHRDLVRAAVSYRPQPDTRSVALSRAMVLVKKYGGGLDLVKKLPYTTVMLPNNVPSHQILVSEIDWALRFDLAWALKWAKRRHRLRSREVANEVDAITRRDRVAGLLRSLGLNVALGMQHPVVAQVLAGGPIAKGLETIEQLVPSTSERSLRWTSANFHPQVSEFLSFDHHDPVKAYVYHNLEGEALFARAAALSARLRERDELLGTLTDEEKAFLDRGELFRYLTTGEGRGLPAIRASALLRRKRAAALESLIATTMHPRVRAEAAPLIHSTVWFEPGPICGQPNALAALQAISARLVLLDTLHAETERLAPGEVAVYLRLGTGWSRLQAISARLRERDDVLQDDEKRRKTDHFIKECDTLILPTDPTSIKEFVERNL